MKYLRDIKSFSVRDGIRLLHGWLRCFLVGQTKVHWISQIQCGGQLIPNVFNSAFILRNTELKCCDQS